MTQPALGVNHSSFAFLSEYDPLFLQLAQSAERAFADRIEQAAHAALSRVNNLSQSILAKAFRGELNADWRAANLVFIRDENSANAFLARIKADRAMVKQKKANK